MNFFAKPHIERKKNEERLWWVFSPGESLESDRGPAIQGPEGIGSLRL